MKISKEIIVPLIKVIREAVEPEDFETDDQILSVYYLEEITLTFSQGEKPGFFGMVFESLGRDFTILTDLELLVTAEEENEDGEEEAYQVEDRKLISYLEEYLLWRTKVCKEFSL